MKYSQHYSVIINYQVQQRYVEIYSDLEIRCPGTANTQISHRAANQTGQRDTGETTRRQYKYTQEIQIHTQNTNTHKKYKYKNKYTQEIQTKIQNYALTGQLDTGETTLR